MRTHPRQTVRTVFPHTASRVKLVSSVSPSCEGYQPEFLVFSVVGFGAFQPVPPLAFPVEELVQATPRVGVHFRELTRRIPASAVGSPLMPPVFLTDCRFLVSANSFHFASCYRALLGAPYQYSSAVLASCRVPPEPPGSIKLISTTVNTEPIIPNSSPYCLSPRFLPNMKAPELRADGRASREWA